MYTDPILFRPYTGPKSSQEAYDSVGVDNIDVDKSDLYSPATENPGKKPPFQTLTTNTHKHRHTF